MKIRDLPPKPSDDLQFEFLNLMRVVAEGLENEVRGKTPGDKHTIQKFTAIYEDFECALKAGMPAFQVGGTEVGFPSSCAFMCIGSNLKNQRAQLGLTPIHAGEGGDHRHLEKDG